MFKSINSSSVKRPIAVKKSEKTLSQAMGEIRQSC